MKKRILSFGIILVVILGFFAACGTGDNRLEELQKQIEELQQKVLELEEKNQALTEQIKKVDDFLNSEVIVEKPTASNLWDGKVEVSLSFPRIVKQGETFAITVTTKNISDEDFTYMTCFCCVKKGVILHNIKLQVYMGDGNEKGWTFNFAHLAAGCQNTILAGESLEYTWIIKTNDLSGDGFRGFPPKGIYEIHLSNGEIYKNAIMII